MGLWFDNKSILKSNQSFFHNITPWGIVFNSFIN